MLRRAAHRAHAGRPPAVLAAAAVLALALAAPASGADVRVYLTKPGDHGGLARQKDLHFAKGAGANSTIDVDPARRLQRITGFGAAFTDSSLYLLSKLPLAQRLALLRRLLEPYPGIGLSVMRVPIAASDFTASGVYSYDDLPAGQTDPRLTHFSIAHDRAYVLPILREALTIDPSLKIIATPWSPPAWMKTNDSAFAAGGAGVGTLRPDAYAPFAQYFVKFIEAYRRAGVPIWAITPQNEPEQPTSDYSGMILSPAQEALFVRDSLAPALKAAHLDPRVYGYDYVWLNSEPYVSGMFALPGAESAFSGIAYHCYFGDPDAMTTIHTLYPAMDPIEDECSTGISALSPIQTIIRSVDNSATVALMWNVALDPAGGPKIGTGCLNCIGEVTINPSAKSVSYTGDYYQLGQVAAFVRPGARHVAAAATPAEQSCANSPVCGLEYAAFRNPDGSDVLAVTNSGTQRATFAVRRSDGTSFKYSLAGQTAPKGTDDSRDAAVATFVWNSRGYGTDRNHRRARRKPA